MMLLMVCVLVEGKIAYADSEDGWYHVHVLLNDETEGEFTDDIEIKFYAENEGFSPSKIATQEDYAHGFKFGFSLMDDRASRLEFIYPQSDKYCIMTRDGQIYNMDLMVTKEMENQILEFQICPIALLEAETVVQDNEVSNSSGMFVSTDNVEIDKIVNEYLAKAYVMVGDKKYDTFFSQYDSKNRHAERYEQYCGKTKEEWFEYTCFEQFIMYETYVKPCMYIGLSDYDYYFGSIEKFRSNIAGTAYKSLARADQEQADLFLEMMEWQYEYIVQNGSPYNILTGKSAVEENADLESIAAANAAAKEAADAKDREYLAAVRETIMEEENIVDEQVALLSSVDEASSSSSNGLVIIIVTAIIVCGAVAIVAILKKKQN